MSFYQTLIREVDPSVNPAGVEASMRLQYGTLNHLPRETFELEIRVAKACEAEQPGFLRGVAQSFGMLDDFHRWDRLN